MPAAEVRKESDVWAEVGPECMSWGHCGGAQVPGVTALAVSAPLAVTVAAAAAAPQTVAFGLKT